MEFEKEPFYKFNIEQYINEKFSLNDSYYEQPVETAPFYKVDNKDKTVFNPVLAHFHQSKDPAEQQHLLGLVMPIDEIVEFDDIYNPETWKKIAEEYPYVAGVYIFYGINDQPIYIGETKNFLNRFQAHISGTTNTKQIVFSSNLYHPCNYFKRVELYKLHHDGESNRKVIERMLFYLKQPLHNWHTEKLLHPNENNIGFNYWGYLDREKNSARSEYVKFTKHYRDKLRVYCGHMTKNEYVEKHYKKSIKKVGKSATIKKIKWITE